MLEKRLICGYPHGGHCIALGPGTGEHLNVVLGFCDIWVTELVCRVPSSVRGTEWSYCVGPSRFELTAWAPFCGRTVRDGMEARWVAPGGRRHKNILHEAVTRGGGG